MKSIASEKAFIEKVEGGFKLERLTQFKRNLFYLTNYRDTEITVSKALIEKLESKGIIDQNWDVHLPS